MNLENINIEITNLSSKEQKKVSDGWHTFGELYEFRKYYNALLFNEWARRWKKNKNVTPVYDVHKSMRHYDGEMCFGGGWFIVVANLPTGQISNHYKIDDWELFKIPAVEKAKYEYDNHTAEDVIKRMDGLIELEKGGKL